MANEVPAPVVFDNDLREQAAQNTLAANPLVGIRLEDILDSARLLFGQMLSSPGVAAREYLHFLGELGRIATGGSELAPDAKDKRFADSAWKDSAIYRALAQCYLAWGGALNRFVDEAKMEKGDAERARFIISLLVDAMAPTNSILGKPVALRKLVETRGASVVHGLENLTRDLAHNGGLPAQVDKNKFAVGKNLATTTGAVVYRSPVLELIQYRPMSNDVYTRPLLIIPPQINKFYVFDLAPEKSIVQFALKGDLQTFAISWKNPTAHESHFGLDTYVRALEEAVDVIRDITQSDELNVWGACSGGITMSAFLANLAARNEAKVHSATLAVCLLDMASTPDTPAGIFVTPASVVAAKQASRLAGVLEGQELARMFAWMRPNDLIWNYWVNNYLLGNQPPAFDILYWNADTTRLPAALHGDYLDLYFTNPFVNAGKLTLNEKTVDMSKVKADSYVIAGVTDHITPWKGVYKTAQIMGEGTTFVLSNSGHLQSLLNPPTNPKASFMIGPVGVESPDAFLATAEKRKGSWWLDWRDWLHARSGEEVAAPASLGSARHPTLGAAPGTYVFE